VSDFNAGSRRRKSAPVGLIVGGVVLLVAAASAAWLYFSSQASMNREPLPAVSARAVQKADCAWIHAQTTDASNDAHVMLVGSAGDPEAAVAAVHEGLKASGYGANKIEADSVRPVDKGLCKALDSLRVLNTALPAPLFSTRGAPYKLGRQPECGPGAAMGTFAGDFPPEGKEEVAVVHLGMKGLVETAFIGRSGFQELQKRLAVTGVGYMARTVPAYSTIKAAKGFVLNVCEEGAGTHGILMLRGDPAVLAKLDGITTADGLAASGFASAAAKAGVKAQLDWNKVD
jgi:hypothetical protein